MKRLMIIFSAMFLCISSLFSQTIFNWGGTKTIKASKVYVTKEFKIDNYNCIEVAGNIELIYKQAAGQPTMSIYTSDNVVNLIEVDVVDEVLKIKIKKGYSISNGKLIVNASSEHLYGISLAGSGTVDLSNGVKTTNLKLQLGGSGEIMGKNIFCQEDLRIAISGSGDVDMQQLVCNQFGVSLSGSGDVEINNIDANNAKVAVAGSGDMELKGIICAKADVEVAGSGCIEMDGKTNEAYIQVAGSGEVSAEDFLAKDVIISIAGSGDVECHATDYLKASIAGSGEVGYKGNPKLEVPKRGVHKL